MRRVREAWESVVAVDRFVRLHQLFFTALWSCLGAATLGRDLSAGELGGLLAVTFCFHVYTYVLNDVIDLPIDRTQASRQNDALVRGVVRPSHALAIALLQPVLTIPLTVWLGGSLQAHLALAAGFVCMGAYDIWGKRCAFPPLTDAIQGLAWGLLAVYAPLALGGEAGTLAWLVLAYAVVLTLFFNGIHGSLRDLDSDLASGARTTAIVMGARPAPALGAPRVPASIAAYASVLLILLAGISAVLMVRNDFGYAPIPWAVTTLAVTSINLAAVIVHRKVVFPRGPEWNRAWRLQLYLVVISLPVAFAAYAAVNLLIALVLLHVVALALFGSTPDVTRWAWVVVRAALVAAHEKRVPHRVAPTD
jgi:4-hydroxybenzoate polyprenyltransferase